MPPTYANRHKPRRHYPGPEVSEADMWELSQPVSVYTYYPSPARRKSPSPARRKSPSPSRAAANVTLANIQALEKKRRSLIKRFLNLFRR